MTCLAHLAGWFEAALEGSRNPRIIFCGGIPPAPPSMARMPGLTVVSWQQGAN
jgi:hypothetical protein